MLEGQLAFPHISKPRFIDQRIGNCPGVAGVELLIARTDIGPESRNVRAGGLEIVEGSKIRIVREVIVEAEILPRVNVVVQPDRELVLSIGARRYSLIKAASTIRPGNEAEHIDGDRVLTIGRDYICRKDVGPRQRIRATK